MCVWFVLCVLYVRLAAATDVDAVADIVIFTHKIHEFCMRTLNNNNNNKNPYKKRSSELLELMLCTQNKVKFIIFHHGKHRIDLFKPDFFLSA